MPDDIVTRLREQVDNHFCYYDGEKCADCRNANAAADEIERLGADMKELVGITKLFADEGECRNYEKQWGYCTHSHCDWHDAEHMWESFCMSRGI